MDCSFMGQHVGNCNNFSSTQYICHALWPKKKQRLCAPNIISNLNLFHSKSINLPIPKNMDIKNLTLKICGEGHGWGQSWNSQCESNILLTHIPLFLCQSALPSRRHKIFNILIWKSRVKVKWPWCCTTASLDNSKELIHHWYRQHILRIMWKVPTLHCFVVIFKRQIFPWLFQWQGRHYSSYLQELWYH